MNHARTTIFTLLIASLVLGFYFSTGTQAQNASPSPSPTPENPFAPETAPALPPGMTGSDTSDPRANLTPGMYDAGEAARGLKHLLLVKTPDAFQLGADNPDDPKVQKTLSLLGIGDTSKLAKSAQLPTAQLAFANSDLAFQGNRLFMGNFYGLNIYDISTPGGARLLLLSLNRNGKFSQELRQIRTISLWDYRTSSSFRGEGLEQVGRFRAGASANKASL